jgi:hypothetical protein
MSHRRQVLSDNNINPGYLFIANTERRSGKVQGIDPILLAILNAPKRQKAYSLAWRARRQRQFFSNQSNECHFL